MTSDWRVLPAPLDKIACRGCGLVARRDDRLGPSLYAEGYTLYAHAPGAAFERARQAQYAGWIAEAAAAHSRGAPRRILDVGCGNGSLLLALAATWPTADLIGCDPSADALAHADGRLRVRQGTSATLAAREADLVVAVNVIEHTRDPIAFLADLRRACVPGGLSVIVCPDGARPGLELLFADHLYSFSASHLRAMAVRAGFSALATLPAPPALGTFQMLVASASAAAGATVVHSAFADPGVLNESRADWLRRWQALDGALAARLPAPVVCFGVGEAAGLLRAYAPRTWARIRACTADRQALDPASPDFGGLPIVPLDTLPRSTSLLVGVRPTDQATVRDRLARQFASVTTWYDLVGEAN